MAPIPRISSPRSRTGAAALAGLAALTLACGGGGQGARDARPVAFGEPERMFTLPFAPSAVLAGNFESDDVWAELAIHGEGQTVIEIHANDLRGGFESTPMHRLDLQRLLPEGAPLTVGLIAAENLDGADPLDFLVLNRATGEVLAVGNRGGGAIALLGTAPAVPGAVGYAQGRFNTDESRDLALATDRRVHFLWRDAGRLAWHDSRSAVEIGQGVALILAGDFMSRGSDEMLAAGGGGIQLIRRNRNRVFVPDEVQRLDVTDAVALITPDLNGDGFIDLVAARPERGEVGLWLMDVDREWVANRPAEVDLPGAAALAAWDVTGDGLQDLLVGSRPAGRDPAGVWRVRQAP